MFSDSGTRISSSFQQRGEAPCGPESLPRSRAAPATADHWACRLPWAASGTLGAEKACRLCLPALSRCLRNKTVKNLCSGTFVPPSEITATVSAPRWRPVCGPRGMCSRRSSPVTRLRADLGTLQTAQEHRPALRRRANGRTDSTEFSFGRTRS